jgi:hypothetical protein
LESTSHSTCAQSHGAQVSAQKVYVVSQYKIPGTSSGVTQIMNKQEGLVQIPRIRTKIIPVGSHYNQGARKWEERLHLRSVLETKAKANPDQ